MKKKDSSSSELNKIPKYRPTNENVELDECVDMTKYLELTREINASLEAGKITEEEAKFLKLCATRWIKFYYAKVAQWFAIKASSAMQKHLQRSTMVLIDRDNKFEDAVLDARNYFNTILKRYVTEHSIDLYSHIDIEKSNMVDEEALAKLKASPPPESEKLVKSKRAGRKIRQSKKS